MGSKNQNVRGFDAIDSEIIDATDGRTDDRQRTTDDGRISIS